MLYFSHRTSTNFCSSLISKIHVCEWLEPKWLRQWSDGDPTPRGVVGFVFLPVMSFRSTPMSREGRATCGAFGAFFYSAPVCGTSRATRGYSCAVFCIAPMYRAGGPACRQFSSTWVSSSYQSESIPLCFRNV